MEYEKYNVPGSVSWNVIICECKKGRLVSTFKHEIIIIKKGYREKRIIHKCEVCGHKETFKENYPKFICNIPSLETTLKNIENAKKK